MRVGVDKRDALAALRPFAGEMERDRRLADAALLVEQRDDHDGLPAIGDSSTRGEKAVRVRKIPKESKLEKLRGL
ncbi:hypothetical protein AA103196_0906 [Ameyamaea chiangmaiensis NBRC 103196]|nr:hypothetical protein AA103196_0906 [Ameyamaea chiangmaiensis NBRC 103196]